MGILNDIEDIPSDISKFASTFRSGTSYNTKSINDIGNSNAILYANSILQYTLRRSIRYGDRGQIVKDLEYVLNSLGYKTYSTSSPDGVYGNRVKSAVSYIQIKKGITNDGIVGSTTARILYNLVSNDMKSKYVSNNVYSKYANSRNDNIPRVNITKAPKKKGIEKDMKKYWWMPVMLLAVLFLINT